MNKIGNFNTPVNPYAAQRQKNAAAVPIRQNAIKAGFSANTEGPVKEIEKVAGELEKKITETSSPKKGFWSKLNDFFNGSGDHSGAEESVSGNWADLDPN